VYKKGNSNRPTYNTEKKKGKRKEEKKKGRRPALSHTDPIVYLLEEIEIVNTYINTEKYPVSSPYLTVNTLRLGYKNQSVSAV